MAAALKDSLERLQGALTLHPPTSTLSGTSTITDAPSGAHSHSQGDAGGTLQEHEGGGVQGRGAEMEIQNLKGQVKALEQQVCVFVLEWKLSPSAQQSAHNHMSQDLLASLHTHNVPCHTPAAASTARPSLSSVQQQQS